jgi:acetolactate synthase-1/2/3 large subunit
VKLTGGAILTRALEDAGIELAFGIPGTHNIELYDALFESKTVRIVLVTDEQSASFMADGAWRSSGRMACVNLVPGAGLTHAMSGIAEAFLDHVPMLVLGCGIRRDTQRAFQLHDVDQEALARPVVKGTYRPEAGDDLYGTIRKACDLAQRGAPGPVFVEVPMNLYLFKHEVDLDTEAAEAAWASTADHAPAPDSIRAAAELIAGAKRPLMYVGAGAVGALDEVLRLAELLDAPVSTTFQGKGVFPEDHALSLWPGYGQTAPSFVRKIAEDCDLTIAVGCRFSEVGTGSYALEPQGPLIHIDIDPDALGRNYQTAVAIAADAKLALRELIQATGDEHRPYDEARRERIRRGHAEVWEEWLAYVGAERVTPAHLLRTAQRVFGPGTIYTTDSGNGTFLAMECLRLDRPRKYLAPVDFSCMGYSVPSALGAKLASPEHPVVALAGDGAFLMTGLEMLTAVQEGIGAVIIVLRDRELAQIAQIQSTALNRKVASAVHEYELRHFAAAVHVDYLHLEIDGDVEDTLRQAQEITLQGRPVLVEVEIDYSRRTFFTKGVLKANLHRLPFKDRMRFIGRAVYRKLTE